MEAKKVLLLGASGSIGGQTVDIIDEAKDKFQLVGFSIGHNLDKALEILRNHKTVKMVSVVEAKAAFRIAKEFPHIKIYFGKSAIKQITKRLDFDMCVNALVGIVGLEPSVITLKRNKILCLANKEALVTGGHIINPLLKNGFGKLYPIDSEHVALAKCLANCKQEEVEKLIITASGGALRNVPLEELDYVNADKALQHPTWKMGKKITIDCATMMNKGFEVIEAYYLFNYPLSKIEIMMHDESLVHSMLLLKDGSYIVEYGKPDMHNPIRWAMYEGDLDYKVLKIKSLDELKDCHFHKYNPKRYPCAELAKQSLLYGPSKMIALNASNEVLVNKYLNNEIGFLDISKGVEKAVNNTKINKNLGLHKVLRLDKLIRRETK